MHDSRDEQSDDAAQTDRGLSQLAAWLRDRLQRWRVRRRRRKLWSAYATVGRIRHDLGPGLSPNLYALDRLLEEGLVMIDDADGEADLVWHWPEGAPDTVDLPDDLDGEVDILTDGGVDPTCPECDREADVVVDVHALGKTETVHHGAVHVDRTGGAGTGWRLYCHATEVSA